MIRRCSSTVDIRIVTTTTSESLRSRLSKLSHSRMVDEPPPLSPVDQFIHKILVKEDVSKDEESSQEIFSAAGKAGMRLYSKRASADNILRDLKANPDTWLQVVHILQNTRSTHTKYFALQVLDGVIKYRWNALPVEQRDGMKNYISEVIVQLSRDEASFRAERLYVNKLNIILVQIVKHEWYQSQESFMKIYLQHKRTSTHRDGSISLPFEYYKLLELQDSLQSLTHWRIHIRKQKLIKERLQLRWKLRQLLTMPSEMLLSLALIT